jgi:NarL family two-component system response regulator LiaR
VNPNPTTVFIADDHAMVRRGIRAFLETQPDLRIVGEAADGHAAAEACGRLQPDVVLLDLLMPGGGPEGAAAVRAAAPASRIVVVTSSEDESHILPALRAGALSYVLKDLDPESLADAVRRAGSGESVLHPRVASLLASSVRRGEPAPAASLSTRERDVLQLIAEGLPNHEIATRLGIGEKTVKTHVSNVLAKTGTADRTQAAVYAWRAGLVRK